MKKSVLILTMIISILALAFKSDLPAYRLFNKDGKKMKYEKLVKDALEADIVLFGELHNNPIAHWLQFELTHDLFNKIDSGLVIGAEMFESDNQLILDEYLQGNIRTRNFEAEARLWTNYDTDYKPLVEFAKEKGLAFIATNIPRRYASAVFKGGFEALEDFSDEAKFLLPPLPVKYDPELPAYKAMVEEMSGMGGHGGENFPKAQAVKDATMAYFILKNLPGEGVFIHYNGAFHSNNYEGIVWYLQQEDPNLNILTISTVEQVEIEDLDEENLEIADYIIAVPESMTKTH
jgi:uncharacterized iron-regulated protein